MSRSRRKVPVGLAKRIRQQARGRCGYCLSSETLTGMPMELEHLVPLASGGQTIEENLWLSCRRCNDLITDLRSIWVVLGLHPLE